MTAPRSRRIVREADVLAPGLLRSDGPGLKTAAAVRADVVKHVLDAVGAEGALVRADPGIRSGRRQILVAQLAVWAKLEHGARLTILDEADPLGLLLPVAGTPERRCRLVVSHDDRRETYGTQSHKPPLGLGDEPRR